MINYDFIVTGGGAAGRSLVCHLLRSRLKDSRILLIDRERKSENDRTWCFWERGAGFFEDIVFHRWQHLWVATDGFRQLLPIAPYIYKLIRGIDFYEYTDRLIDQHPNVERLYGEVAAIEPKAHQVIVEVNDEQYTAPWCFNSILFKPVDKTKVNYLDQHFRGWFIRTASPVFDPSEATLMDFRIPQHGETRFMYVLPYSTTEALIEVAIFSNNHLAIPEYDVILDTYIKEYLPAAVPYEISQYELGNIPMTDYPFRRSDGRVIHLGTAGGDTRPATGYTFYNIQRRVAAIVEQLQRSGSPQMSRSIPLRRAHFYDRLMLRVLEQGYHPGAQLFEELFRHNPPQQILAFLNAESSLPQELSLAHSLPNLPFLRALRDTAFQSRFRNNEPNLPASLSKVGL